MRKQIVIENKLEQLPSVATFTEELCYELSLGTDVAFNLNLVLEEALANTISYAFPDDDEIHEIVLTAQAENNELSLIIEDDGIGFDPTKVADPDITLTAEDRSIGGLGIFLIRQIMDDVSYQRINEHNLLTMKKKL